jgi:demethylspheroidene O-methyltransferase
MAASQPLVADLVLDAYPFTRHRRLLDVGGGEGAFLRAAARRVPALERGLFDLPAVVDRAAAQRVPATCHRGDFLRDDLPGGYDLVTLVRILHDHDDAPALALLRRVRAALPPGGRLMIAEPMAGTRGAEAMGDAYFGFYLLAMGSGRPRTAEEIRAMLTLAGFGKVTERSTAMPLSVRVIVAEN